MSAPLPAFFLRLAQRTALSPTRMVTQRSASDLPEFEWAHVLANHPDTSDWLVKEGMDGVVVDAMVAKETRPRILMRENGALVILRAMNLHAGADPEDMISLRLWLDERRVITARRRDIVAIQDVVDMVERGTGPQSTGDFLTTIVERVFARMEPVLEELEMTLAKAEECLIEGDVELIVSDAALIRKRTTIFTRFVVPQRVVLESLLSTDFNWLGESHKSVLNEALDRVIRYTEELHEIRDRAQILNSELNNAQARRLNEITYMFSVAATVFLPLSFLTGLMGINVGGVPGMDNPTAFWWFTSGCVIVMSMQVILFKRLEWF